MRKIRDSELWKNFVRGGVSNGIGEGKDSTSKKMAIKAE